MEGYDESTYGDRFAEVYDEWYGEVSDAAACAERVAALCAQAGHGPVLELGIGTRPPRPAAGRAGPGRPRDRRVGGDGGPAAGQAGRRGPARDHRGHGRARPWSIRRRSRWCFVAFNTFFNLGTEAAQRRCLERVAALLAPDGWFLLEGFVPGSPGGVGIDGAVTPRRITADEVVLSASQRDRAAQTITGQHVHITEAGIRLRPWHLRYATPAQLDAMAADAGLELAWRAAGWSDQPFTDDSDAHVSAYRRGRFEA